MCWYWRQLIDTSRNTLQHLCINQYSFPCSVSLCFCIVHYVKKTKIFLSTIVQLFLCTRCHRVHCEAQGERTCQPRQDSVDRVPVLFWHDRCSGTSRRTPSTPGSLPGSRELTECHLYLQYELYNETRVYKSWTVNFLSVCITCISHDRCVVFDS